MCHNTIPLTRAALLEHTKRAAYQGGHVWGQSLNFSQDIPSPEDWGWTIGTDECYWTPNWTTLPAIAASCQGVLKCGCKRRSCSARCKWYKAGLSCTGMCSCNWYIVLTHGLVSWFASGRDWRDLFYSKWSIFGAYSKATLLVSLIGPIYFVLA